MWQACMLPIMNLVIIDVSLQYNAFKTLRPGVNIKMEYFYLDE